MSLVPDYDNSDSETSEDSESSDTEENKPIREKNNIPKQVLPSAKILLSGKPQNEGGVFNNPFKAAESAKIASLEKHVKMVKTDENVKTINGKKICWNYRKGRCRFGSKCTFAHDSDIQKSSAETLNLLLSKELNSEKITDDCIEKVAPVNSLFLAKSGKNKRPGLGNNIVPSKKVMKNYVLQKKN